MKTPLFIAAGLLSLAFSSCKRDNTEPQPYSYWTIGNDSFSTNNTTYHVGNKSQISTLSVAAQGSKFGYVNSYGSIPGNGTYSLDYFGTNNPDFLDVWFVKDRNVVYKPFDSSSYMVISRANGITTMEMPLTRFRNTASTTADTQWIKATIRVREK